MRSTIISFVIAGTPRPKRSKEVVQSPTVKSAPHYFEATVPQQFIVSQESVTLRDKEGQLLIKTYPPDILIAEIRFELSDIFTEDVLDLKEEAINFCRAALQKKGAKDVEEFSEEYSIYILSGYEGEPEQFLKNKERIAALLKSEKLALDPLEVDYTLSAQIKYAKNDLVIVDWDGAFIFDPEGDIESTVELLELANLQLLRYRLLDRQLDERLERMAKLVAQAPVRTQFLFKAGEISQALKETIIVRSTSISEFQALEREIKLIGDWYSARLYDLVSKKFKLEEWRRAVKDKLEALEDIYSIASENFTISWERRGRLIEMIGWYVLLFGWLVLLILDIYYYKP
jgi:hypothetical protein